VATAWIEKGRLKRLVDLAIAAPALVTLAPLTLIVAIAVRLRLGAPVLFRQERAGRGGRPVTVPKFRSMTDDRDEHGELLPDADRLTAFGRRLRSTSLDELPQLWTIVRGDMSLIGPRPLPTAYVGRYSDRQRRRLEARPGLTGWAQVHGRNAVDWPERLEYDVWYVEHASWRVDLEILRRTISMVLRRDGVSADGEATMSEFTGTESTDPG
jgi:lipopolysaccharide/colanic/teichoic acid biosynthesis glycosyltransferase